jgi:hypothetical protein
MVCGQLDQTVPDTSSITRSILYCLISKIIGVPCACTISNDKSEHDQERESELSHFNADSC